MAKPFNPRSLHPHPWGTLMIAFALLLAAMAAFLASTIQMRLWVRGLFWVGGAGALAGATIYAVSGADHRGFFQLLEDALRNAGDPSKSVIWQSVTANHRNMSAHMLPLADVLLVIGTLAGLVALLAFTKGERLERLVRPVLIGLIGAVLGGVFTLGVQALGLGDLVKQRAYPASFTAEDTSNKVYDGDTFQLGEFSLRLYGADAPELEQKCIDSRFSVTPCGREARAQLHKRLREQVYLCRVETRGRDARAQDSFGRPLVRCHNANGEELAPALISAKWAKEYRQGEPTPDTTSTQLVAGDAMVVAGERCTLQPRVWRRNKHKQQLMQDGAAAQNREWTEQLLAQCLPRPNSDNPR